MYLLPNICLLATLLTIPSEAQLTNILKPIDKIIKDVGEIINPILNPSPPCHNFHCEGNIVTLECPDGYTRILNKCFKTINKELNWEEAKNECKDIGGSLAIINDCNLLKPVSKFLSDSSPDSATVWIGAFRKEDEGLWTWVDGTSVQMGVPFWGTRNMQFLAPSPEYKIFNCAKLDANKAYYFYDANCTNLGTPLCQAEPLSCICEDDAVKKTELVCPKDFEVVGGSCFYFPPHANGKAGSITFDEARDVCKRFYPDSRLPVLDSCKLFTELVDFINKNEKYQTINGYWINATRSEGRLFIWGNGKELEPGNPFWGEGLGYDRPSPFPELKCTIMLGYNHYYFFDYLCDDEYVIYTFPLCQADPIPLE